MESTNKSENNRTIVEMDDLSVCAEVVFEDCEVPYDTYRFGNITDLKAILSEEFLAAEAERKQASSAYVNNIYFKGRGENNAWRMELRIGNHSEIDLESLILKEEE